MGTISGRAGSEDGPEVTVPLAIVTRFENSHVVRTEEYLDVTRAFAAAGLS